MSDDIGESRSVRSWTVPMPYGVQSGGLFSTRLGDEWVMRFTGTEAELLGLAQMIVEHVGKGGPCRAVLNIGGEHFQCQESHPHRGLGHGNSQVGAIWVGHEDVLRSAQDWRAATEAGH